MRAGAAGLRVLVHGASRGIGLALVERLLADTRVGAVFASCRQPDRAEALQRARQRCPALTVVPADSTDEASLSAAAGLIRAQASALDMVIHCAGLLHDSGGLRPERRLADVRASDLLQAFQVNALGALLLARAVQPLLQYGRQPLFAALSARVGSIGDNRLGGWYAYRSSKAALNMLVRTLAVEWARLDPPVTAVLLHPGTVATDLSAPFLRGERRASAFTPELAATRLLAVLGAVTPRDTGRFLAWDGADIPW